jgi:hypothetical protein
MYPPPGTPDMPTEEKTATATSGKNIVHESSFPNTPNRNAIFRTHAKHDPSICMEAPRGTTISETSFEMPVCSATSILVGIVATEEHVPRATTAGFAICRNISFTAPFPPPMAANRGKAVKK